MWKKSSNLSHLLFCNLDLTFFWWQAPRWYTCKLHICSFFVVADSQMTVVVESWKLTFFTFFLAVAGPQAKMWQLQTGYSWRLGGGRLPDENATLASCTFVPFFGWQAPRWAWQLQTEISWPFFFAVAGSQVKMWQLQAGYSWFFCGGRLPAEPSWPFFCGGRLPSENVTAASWICLTFLRWQAPRWAWQLKTKPSLPFFAVAGSQVKMWQLQAGYSWRFCGGRLPDKCGGWKLNLLCSFFWRWQAPRWKCDSCKLPILDVFAVAGSQMSVAVEN